MSRDKVLHFLFNMLVGFAVGCAIIHAAGGEPLAAMHHPVNLAVQYQPARASMSKFMQPMQPIKARTSAVVANAQPEAETGRRNMMAGAFGLALAASTRAAVASTEAEDAVRLQPEKVYEKAEDFTSYNKVQTKRGFVPKAPKESKEVAKAEPKPGSVEAQPLLVPGVVVFTALVSAGVPALLSAGQTAKDAQDAQSSAGRIKKSIPAGNRYGQKKVPAAKTTSKKSGFFR